MGEARDAIIGTVELARARTSRNNLWRLLGAQAQIEAALGLNETADKTRAEAKALLAEIAATVPDLLERQHAAWRPGRRGVRIGGIGRLPRPRPRQPLRRLGRGPRVSVGRLTCRSRFTGFCDPRFQSLKDAFVANFEAGLELGASLALTYRGRTVVDLWGGFADAAKTRPWEKDTIVPSLRPPRS